MTTQSVVCTCSCSVPLRTVAKAAQRWLAMSCVPVGCYVPLSAMDGNANLRAAQQWLSEFLCLQAPREDCTAPDAEQCWKAPELLRCDPPAMSSDAFAFGMVIFQMLQQAQPFDGENPEVSFCQAASQSHGLSSQRRLQDVLGPGILLLHDLLVDYEAMLSLWHWLSQLADWAGQHCAVICPTWGVH